MRVECAWCKKIIANPEDQGLASHTICPDCKGGVLREAVDGFWEKNERRNDQSAFAATVFAFSCLGIALTAGGFVIWKYISLWLN